METTAAGTAWGPGTAACRKAFRVSQPHRLSSTSSRQIDVELQKVGIEALHPRVQQVDPLSAAKLHPHDKRRIIRALEVYRLTGRPISHLQTQFEEGRPAAQCRVFTLSWTRPELHARINGRVISMFAAGWLQEVRGLLARYGTLSRIAMQAVGYRELLEHLGGQRDLPATPEAVKARTRRFARHQETWFRSLSECRPVACREDQTDRQVAEQIRQQGLAVDKDP